jgi:hypothetical protein
VSVFAQNTRIATLRNFLVSHLSKPPSGTHKVLLCQYIVRALRVGYYHILFAKIAVAAEPTVTVLEAMYEGVYCFP